MIWVSFFSFRMYNNEKASVEGEKELKQNSEKTAEEMLSETYNYLRRLFYQLFRVEVILLDQSNQLLPCCHRPDYSVEVLVDRCDLGRIRGAGQKIASLGENVYFGFVPLPEGYLCVIGPVGGEALSDQQAWNYQVRFRARQGKDKIPRWSFLQIQGMVELADFILRRNGEKDTEDKEEAESDQGLDADEGDGEYEIISNQIQNVMEGRTRYTYQYEQQYFQMIENGEPDKIRELEQAEHALYSTETLRKVGVIAKNSDFKQMEYMAVTSVALASRAAIRGNARPDVCYDLSDLFLQRISVARNVMEIYEISREIVYRFAREVEKEKKARSGHPLTEQCKNYIARHLYTSFTVEQMADELSVGRTYLSGLFKKETGRSIRDYILEQRVRTAANLLRYSNESIGTIAEYMQFSSASRFSAFFRRYYGMTPAEYRKKNKLIEFM